MGGATGEMRPRMLTDREFTLIVALRERYRFGRVTVVMRDGVFTHVEQTVKFDDLKDVDIRET